MTDTFIQNYCHLYSVKKLATYYQTLFRDIWISGIKKVHRNNKKTFMRVILSGKTNVVHNELPLYFYHLFS